LYVWNPKQSRLRETLSDINHFDEAMQICLELHRIVHSGKVSGSLNPTYYDEIWNGLSREAFITMPTTKDVTIAWNIWHITRIEDITANMLIMDDRQILDDMWLKKLGTNVRDTGTSDKIVSFAGLRRDFPIRSMRIRTMRMFQFIKYHWSYQTLILINFQNNYKATK